MTDHALTPETLAELEDDVRHLVFVSDGSRGSDRLARILKTAPALIAAARPTVETAHVTALIEASSLGAPEAKAARESVPRSTAVAIAKAARYLAERDAALAEVATLTRQRDGWREAVKTTAEQRERRRAEVVALRERVESWIAERLIGLDPDGLLHPVRLAQAEELRAALDVDTAGHDDSSERDGGR